MERWDSIGSQFGLPPSSELRALPPPVFQPFPSLDELAAAPPEAAGPRDTGLFEGLLGSRAEAVYVDALEFPEKYEDGVKELLAELVQTQRAPTAAERAILDKAVLDFLATPRPRAERPKPPAPKKLDIRDLPKEELRELAGAAQGHDPHDVVGADVLPVDESGHNPFWWL